MRFRICSHEFGIIFSFWLLKREIYSNWDKSFSHVLQVFRCELTELLGFRIREILGVGQEKDKKEKKVKDKKDFRDLHRHGLSITSS